MTLCDELYFEITLRGEKQYADKFIKYVKSGALEDYIENAVEYVVYEQDFSYADSDDEVEIFFSNDDFGIEIDEFDPEEFLEVFLKGARELFVSGQLYDIEDEEYAFVSKEGTDSFYNIKSVTDFNDELDREAAKEDAED
jgi:hypothetical protein